MVHKSSLLTLSSEAVENLLGTQIEALRLSRNITQSELAKEAGVSRSTISRLSRENAGISLDSFIRILQALDLVEQLESLLPDPDIRPLQRLAAGNQTRKRARHSSSREPDVEEQSWTWKDNGDER